MRASENENNVMIIHRSYDAFLIGIKSDNKLVWRHFEL